MKIDKIKALQYWNNGLLDTEIAERMNCTKEAVCLWRKKNDLPHNHWPMFREEIKSVNKLYFFHGHDEESGVFVGAKTWREARKVAISHECTDDSEFIEIRGSLCRENGKPCYTEVSGEMEVHEILAAGYTSFWWSGECDKCGKWHERLVPLAPFSAEMVCSECEEITEDSP